MLYWNAIITTYSEQYCKNIAHLLTLILRLCLSSMLYFHERKWIVIMHIYQQMYILLGRFALSETGKRNSEQWPGNSEIVSYTLHTSHSKIERRNQIFISRVSAEVDRQTHLRTCVQKQENSYTQKQLAEVVSV